MLLQESWLIKTCTGSQDVQQLWHTEAIFQHQKKYTHQVFNNFITIFQFNILPFQ